MRWGFYEYVPVAEKKESARKKLEQLRKKDPSMQPVTVCGRKIAATFWGAAWNRNLESYADFSHRLERGRSYIRNGMVLDLRIDEGRIRGLVMGSRKTPYKVEVDIDKLPERKWKAVAEECGRKIGGIDELVGGTFPKEYAEIFLNQEKGLFPSPKEIRFSCSCPDWAGMCKHVAAVLYGVGARLDTDPLLFFKLRGIDFGELIKRSAREKMESMLKNAHAKTPRILKDADIAGIFGI